MKSHILPLLVLIPACSQNSDSSPAPTSANSTVATATPAPAATAATATTTTTGSAGVSILALGQSNTAVTAGTRVALTWADTGVTESTCTITSSDSTPLTFSNKAAIVTPAASATYTVSCPNPVSGQPVLSSFATVTVNGIAPAAVATPATGVTAGIAPASMTATAAMLPTAPTTSPGVFIGLNGVAGGTTGAAATAALLSWADLGVTEASCTVSGSDGSNFAFANKAAVVSPTANVTYTVNCPNPVSGGAALTSSTIYSIGTASASVTTPGIVVTTIPLGTVGLSLSANGLNALSVASGTTVALTWQDAGVQESLCSVTSSLTGTAIAPYPNKTAAPVITAPVIFTATCPNPVAGQPALTSSVNITLSSTASTGTGTCAGSVVGGYCWYFAPVLTSCTTLCTTHGGYNSASISYAGSSGSPTNCVAVAAAFSASTPTIVTGAESSGWGCYLNNTDKQIHLSTIATNPSLSSSDARIFCSCMN